jgi:UDPglucose 6-dehydrogenase
MLKNVCKEVIVHDPFVKEFEDVVLTNDLETALRNKDCVVIVTRHKMYSEIDLDWLKGVLATPVIVDGRNVFTLKDCEKAGFSYRGIGVGNEKRRKHE